MMFHTKKPEKFWFVCGLCWAAYVTAYFGRVNLSITLPYIRNAYGYSKASLGIIASGFFGAYAAGQLVNGILGDRLSPRYFVAGGLFAAGIGNILFGRSQGLVPLFICWTVNGYFQSMLWGPMVRTATEATPRAHLQKAAIILSSSTIFGYLLSYTLIGKIVLRFGWKMAFLLPGLMLILAAALWFWLLPLFSANPAAGPAASPVTGPAAEREAKKTGGVLAFFIGAQLWITALVCVFQGSIKEGLTLWGPTFFSEFRSVPPDQVLYIMSLAPLMNLLGMFFCAAAYRLFHYNEKSTLLLFLSLAVFFTVLLRIGGSSANIFFMSLAFCGLFAAIFAVNNILTAFVPLNFRKQGRVSSAAGILDCAVYIGAALSGPLVGLSVDYVGWKGIMEGWIILAVLTLITAFLSRDYTGKNGERRLKKLPGKNGERRLKKLLGEGGGKP
jgi:OPA family glycerol-3-phosphate transporter-like MFS transporter